jgi:hypothetical protein
MKAQPNQGVANRNSEIHKMEAQLQAVLKPVVPRPEFVSDLKRRLTNKPEASVPIKIQEHDILQYGLLTAAGLLSGTLLLIFGVKAVVSLLNSLGVLQNLKPEIGSKPNPPMQTA